MTVGDRIKKRREELSLSQGELAKKMHVSRQAISKAELHGDNITTEKVSKFAAALGVSPGFLMGWTNGDQLACNITKQIPDTPAEKIGADDFNLLMKIHTLNADNYKLLIQMIDTMIRNQ